VDSKVKVALIAAGAAIFCVWLYQYMTPYAKCMREHDHMPFCKQVK
jgi:hypothetical protein